MTVDLVVWKAPRDLDAAGAETLVRDWQSAGGDPETSPFEPSDDVGWFHRELAKDEPGLVLVSDAVPNPSTAPIWLSTGSEPPARVVAIRLPPAGHGEGLDTIFGLAAKYDLVVFDARAGVAHLPLAELAEYASATFWPAGAIRAAVVGGLGAVVAFVAWSLGIPIVSGLVALIGAFLFVMAVYTFVHEGRKAATARRTDRSAPPDR